ncbi:unnamed protein product, partial [Staurois parvus]
ALCPLDTADHGKSRRCRLGHVIRCVQSQLITDHQGTDDQCALMISVAPEVPPVSVNQCQQSVLISATCQCPSVPHISVYQCTSMPHISAYLSCLSVPRASAHQCHISVHTSASQCHLSMPIRATYQCCQSV